MSQTMSPLYPGLPDPVSAPEFYADVASKRLIAWVIDTVIIILITVLLVPLTGFTALFYFPFLALVVGLVYRIVTIANRSATPGMRLTAIEFRTRDGARFDLSMATLHSLGFTVSVAFGILQIVSIILMLTSLRGQGLTDHLLGTVAINRAARS